MTDDIDSCNGLVPSGSKPLIQSVLTQIYVAILRHNMLSNCQYINSDLNKLGLFP